MLPRELLVTGFLAALAGAQNVTTKKCYSLDGQVLGDTYKPCNPKAEFSACCALNGTDVGNNDICLDSGLCQSTSGWYAGFLLANGCTDPTGKADACPRVCAGMPTQYSFNVLQCNPGQFCCRAGYEKDNCCNQTQNMIETSHIGSLLLPGTSEVVNTSYYAPVSSSSDNSSSFNNSTCPADHAAVVGGALGGVLGAALIASLIALALALKTRKTLQSDVAEIKGQRDAALQQSADEKAALQNHFQHQMLQQQQQMQVMAAPMYQANPQYGYQPSPPFGVTYNSQALPISRPQQSSEISPPAEIGTLPRPVELDTSRNPSELSDGVEEVREKPK